MNDTKTVSQYEYAVHPLAALFPEITGDEYDKLKADIAAHGQQEPIILDENSEVLLDGRTRLRICKELGKTPRIDRFTATPAYSEADFIWSRNVMRRHLTPDQRAVLSLEWADALTEAAYKRKVSTLKQGDTKPVMMDSSQRGKTRTAMAKQAKVSEHKIQQTETVAAHAPELLPQVKSGEVSLKDAAATATAAKKAKRPRTIRTSGPLEIERRAAGWLANVLAKFEERGYATADADAILSKLTASEKQIFLHFTEWLLPIRRELYTASKPEHAEAAPESVEARA